MRKLIVALFFTLIILNSCSNKIDFVENGVFVEMRLGLASEEYYLEHFPEIITVNNDGIIKLFTENTYTYNRELNIYVGENPPEVEVKITDEKVEEIKNTITKNHFFSLDTNLTDYDTMDGSSVHVTVYASDEKRKVGGENPNNQEFSNIRDVIFENVADEFYDWREEVREYIYEANGEPLN